MYLGKKDLWKIFPSVGSIASYNPLGNFIYLDKMSEKQFSEVCENPDKYPEHYSVILHEMQHWFDHIGTVWGQQKLLKIFKAFHSVLFGKESEMYKAKSLHDNFKEDRLASYYSETYEDIQGDANNRWKYSFSTGLRYDNNGNLDETKSIIFVRFNSSSNELISRVPISVASLLETTATNTEISSLLISYSKLDSDSKKIQLKILDKKIISDLYNPKLTLYSVAVHAASNILRIKDSITGYSISSKIATLTLNLPSSLFESLKIPPYYNQRWGDRTLNFIKQKDRGFAFLCLVKNYSDNCGAYKETDFTINKLLTSSNLPDLKKIEKLIQDETIELSKELLIEQNLFLNIVTSKVYTGNQLRNERGISQEKIDDSEFDINKMDDLPYFICNDTYFDYDDIDLNNVVKKIQNINPITRKEWWKLFENCEKRIDDFSEICGV